MSKILYIQEQPEKFQSSWGVWFTCQEFEGGYSCDVGWEKELDKRDIKFTTIDLAEHRREKTETLVAAAESFGLGEFIQKFFFTHRNVIQDYILNGGNVLYELFLSENSSDAELDFTNDDGLSPREYAKGLLKPKG